MKPTKKQTAKQKQFSKDNLDSQTFISKGVKFHVIGTYECKTRKDVWQCKVRNTVTREESIVGWETINKIINR